MPIYTIPLVPSQQSFSILLAGINYTMRLIFCDDPLAGWILDIGDISGNPIICGIPLVLNVDLLAQYAYLNFGGSLVALCGSVSFIEFTDLGVAASLYFVTPDS